MTVSGAVLSGLLVYRDYLKYIDNSVADKIELAAYVAEGLLDYSQINTLFEPGAENSDYYQNAIHKLSWLNAKLGTEYIYCVMKNADGEFVFALDSGTVDDPPEDDSFLNTVEDWDNLLVAWDSGELVIDQEYYSDQWGTFRSSCLPLLDDKGEALSSYCLSSLLPALRLVSPSSWQKK
jgi:hypothetical protein